MTRFDFSRRELLVGGAACLLPRESNAWTNGSNQAPFIVNNAAGPNNQSTNDGLVTLPGSPDLTQFHRYGTLWVPASKNGGTGLVKRYFDGTLIAGCFTYSATTGADPAFSPNNPNGVFSLIDRETVMLILASGQGANWPMNVNNVIVVQ
jgi:hypothetical protein